ncbi:MAG TPA: hypothetical protein DDW85_08145 [Porphyromonadaceae bacterium]|nr:hypothetical protein [Porphyromonadaceae bacterium]
MNNKLSFLSLVILLAVLTACHKDDPTPNPENTRNILFSVRIPDASGMSGSVYTQLIDNIDAATYDNKTAIPTAYATPPVIIDDYVFDLPGLTTETDIIKKYVRVNGQLVFEKSFTCPAGSGAISLVTKGDKAYVAMRGLGLILILNHKTMAEIGRIDLSEYGVGDRNPDPAMMLIRDNLLYVGLNQIVGGMTPDPKRAKSDVVIIDTNTDAVQKMITDERGYSMPTNIMGDIQSIFMDENKDIYINCMAGLGYIGHKGGLLRIKAGETVFDNSYEFCVTDKTIEGIDYPLDCLRDMVYTGNGKLYACASVSGYYSPTPDYSADRVVVSLEIDIKNKTVKKLDIPRGNIFATAVGRYGDNILFGLATQTGNGFYTYNQKTKAISESPVINTAGFPFCFKVFKD